MTEPSEAGLIQPVLRDDRFLSAVAAVRSAVRDQVSVWWLGQSGFLVAYAGELLVFDPYLSDSLTRKYAATDKPHVRLTARVVDPARLEGVSVVTSSHTHTDHLDAETLLPMLKASPGARLVLPAANVAFARERLGPETEARWVPMEWAQPVQVGPFRLETVPAAHEERAPGFVGFIVTAGPYRIYHSGDTVRYPGMEETLRPYAVDLALLPINGRLPARRVAGNLDGPEAATLAREIGARWVIPCHYDMFAFNTASPDAFRATCRSVGQPCAILRAGEGWTLPAP